MSFINTAISRIGQIYLSVFIPAYLLNSITNGCSFEEAVFVIGIYGIFIMYDSIVVSYISRISEPKTWNKLYGIVQEMLFKKAVEADLKCYDDPVFFDNYVWSMNECDNRIRKTMYTISGSFGVAISLCLNFAIMIKLTKLSLIFIAISLAITTISQFRLLRISFDLRQKTMLFNRKNTYVRNVLYNKDFAKEIRTTNIKSVVYEKNDNNINGIVDVYRKILFERIAVHFASGFNQVLFLQFGLYIYLAYRIAVTGNMSAGELVAISTATMNAFSVLSSISGTFASIQENSMYVDKLKEFLFYQPQIKENPYGCILDKLDSIDVKNVCFTYPNTSHPAIKNINLNIKSGEKIAIVGYNGSGKTSFIKVLMRFYDPDRGEININGKDIKEYSLNNYRKSFGVVFQDFQCFSATIAQNVLMRDVINKDADERLIYDALYKSGLYEKVSGLPDGIYTVLGRDFDDNGVVFSGGEMQRLAIARIYARDCNVIILDEPSSALDPIMEFEFYNRVFTLFKDKTVIFISHRLTTTKNADKIFMFEKGNIIEKGTHMQLIELNGKYAHMYKVQEAKYK